MKLRPERRGFCSRFTLQRIESISFQNLSQKTWEKKGIRLRKTETDINGRPLSEGNEKRNGVCGMTETDLNGRLLSEGKRGMGLRKTETDLNGWLLSGCLYVVK